MNLPSASGAVIEIDGNVTSGSTPSGIATGRAPFPAASTAETSRVSVPGVATIGTGSVSEKLPGPLAVRSAPPKRAVTVTAPLSSTTLPTTPGSWSGTASRSRDS